LAETVFVELAHLMTTAV